MIGREVFAISLAVLVAMAIGSVLILAVGQSPAHIYHLLLLHSWGSGFAIGQVLFRATPLLFTGLAVALAFRAGLFNIGAEGQMVAGGFATALVAAWLPPGTPALVALPVAIGAGAVAGASLAGIAGLLKAVWGAHEVLVTIMLNFVASAVVLWAGNTWWFLPETTHTRSIAPGAHLPRLGLAGSSATASLVLAALAAAAVWYFLSRTRRGYEWRAVGLGPLAAEAAGVRLPWVFVSAMIASGALAGATATHYVLGYKHYFEEGVGRGVGFMGIAVALLGRNHPAGVVAAALFFATLAQGGVAVSGHVPTELVDVLHAVIILALVVTAATARRKTKG